MMRLVEMTKILVFLWIFSALFAGCATQSSEAPVNTTALTGRREIPWNQPQGWEGRGMLGGFSEQLSTR